MGAPSGARLPCAPDSSDRIFRIGRRLSHRRARSEHPARRSAPDAASTRCSRPGATEQHGARRAARGGALSSAPASGSIAYLDSSAYVKLVLGEPESTALREELAGWHARVSSRLLIVESLRACSRYGLAFAARAHSGLADVALLPMDDELLHAAAHLQLPGLRTLDAIHLASALSIRNRLGVVFCYDARLADAAAAAGLVVARPGASE